MDSLDGYIKVIPLHQICPKFLYAVLKIKKNKNGLLKEDFYYLVCVERLHKTKGRCITKVTQDVIYKGYDLNFAWKEYNRI